MSSCILDCDHEVAVVATCFVVLMLGSDAFTTTPGSSLVVGLGALDIYSDCPFVNFYSSTNDSNLRDLSVRVLFFPLELSVNFVGHATAMRPCTKIDRIRFFHQMNPIWAQFEGGFGDCAIKQINLDLARF